MSEIETGVAVECSHHVIVTTCAQCGEICSTESHDEAWAAGLREGESAMEELEADKDAFIATQGAIIEECMNVFSETKTWGKVPLALYEELRDYV